MKKNLFTKAAAFIAVAALTAGTFAGCSNSGSKDNATTAAGATKAEQTTDKQDNNAAADFDTSKDITVVTREEGSGTRGAFVELTGVEQKNSDGKKIDMTTEEAIVQSSTQNVITAVNGDTYAIGYVSLGSLNKDVKAVKVDGAEATVDTVKSGEYKVQRPFNIATKDDVSDAAKDFISYIMSSEGQAIIEDNGYIKVDDAAAAYAASLIEAAIEMAIEALVKGDADKAREAVEFDDTIDQTQKDIESLCMRILLMQQPVATDLRFVSTALKLVTDMERIGDHAADISEITISLVGSEYVKDLDVIKEMAAKTSGMVIKSVESYVSRNTEEAKEVIAYDDVIDDLFIMEKDEIVRMIGENPKCGSEATDLLMIAKYFERIGDHASNIAEWALYAKTGDINVIQ